MHTVLLLRVFSRPRVYIRHELRQIAASLRLRSDAHQHAEADKKITKLEARIVYLEALKHRGMASLS
jgi:hypothetical protein